MNVAELARNVGIDVRTAGRYLDLLVDLFVARRLVPWHKNAGKRLAKAPRYYVRDSGLLHALLGIRESEELLGHPVVGASFEGFAIENLLASAPVGVEPSYYRTSGGAEVDLVLTLPRGERWVVEVKRSLSPRPERGFHAACEDLRPTRRFVAYPGDERYPLAKDIEAISVADLAAELRRLGPAQEPIPVS